MFRHDISDEELHAINVVAGYRAAWMGDVREDDVVVIVDKDYINGVTTTIRFVRVTRLLPTFDGSYWSEDEQGMIHNKIVHFIGTDDEGVERHFSYSSVYETYIWREDADEAVA